MKERLRRLLVKQNPQWNGQKHQIPRFERYLKNTLQAKLKYEQIIAIVGLRRVGKTILIKQISEQLKVPNNNICYIAMDDIEFQNYEVVEELINYFLEYSDKKKRRYLFLDEIQKLSNWVDLLKSIYDTEENLKIIISGSSGLELKKEKETLAGRILTYYLPIFTFPEFLDYHGFKIEVNMDNIIRDFDLRLSRKKEHYQELFEDYLFKGAFPELLDINDNEFIQQYIRESVVEKAITDISRITRQNERAIFELFKLLANSNAQLFEKKNLASVLGVNRNLVAQYLDMLEKSFLISISYNYSKSIAKQVRLSKKQYVAHSSIVMALLDYPREILRTNLVGHLIEATIKNHIGETSFWRTPQKDEVDIVIERSNGGLLPIEVKYKSTITNQDLRSLIKFCDKFKVDYALVISKDIIKDRVVKGCKIRMIPAWVFLLAWKID